MECLFIPGPVLGAVDKAVMKTNEKTSTSVKTFQSVIY